MTVIDNKQLNQLKIRHLNSKKKRSFLPYLLGLLVNFAYLYCINNSKYMPKNTLFKRLNDVSKNYSFYFSRHFILQNTSKLHLEIIASDLFSARSNYLQLSGLSFHCTIPLFLINF